MNDMNVLARFAGKMQVALIVTMTLIFGFSCIAPSFLEEKALGLVLLIATVVEYCGFLFMVALFTVKQDAKKVAQMGTVINVHQIDLEQFCPGCGYVDCACSSPNKSDEIQEAYAVYTNTGSMDTSE